jgi:methionyl-tRNA formyltransferase
MALLNSHKLRLYERTNRNNFFLKRRRKLIAKIDEQVLGSTFFKFDDGVNDGPVLDQVTIENTPSLTIAQAGDLIQHEWVKRVPKLWKDFCSGKLVTEKQNHDEATYCAQRKEFDGEITWRKDALYIDSFIRAQAHPYPRAFFTYREKKVKIVKHETDVRVVPVL